MRDHLAPGIQHARFPNMGLETNLPSTHPVGLQAFPFGFHLGVMPYIFKEESGTNTFSSRVHSLVGIGHEVNSHPITPFTLLSLLLTILRLSGLGWSEAFSKWALRGSLSTEGLAHPIQLPGKSIKGTSYPPCGLPSLGCPLSRV